MKQLPIVQANNKRWYIDARLGELRSVDNPHEVYKLSSYGQDLAIGIEEAMFDLEAMIEQNVYTDGTIEQGVRCNP